MKGFFDRMLPAEERRDALWIALGGAGAALIEWVALNLPGWFPAVWNDASGGPDSYYVVWLVMGLGIFVWLIVAMTLLRAPRALTLYLVLEGLLGVVLNLSNVASGVAGRDWVSMLPFGSLTFMLAPALAAFVVAAAKGEFSGSLRRMQSVDLDVKPETPAPPPAFRWLGWEAGKTSSRIAVWFVVVAALPRLVQAIGNTLASAAGSAQPGDFVASVYNARLLVVQLIVAAVWFASAFWAVRYRAAPRSVWLPQVVGLGVVMLTSLVMGDLLRDAGGWSGFALIALSSAFVGPVACVLGVWAAVRADTPAEAGPPATLDGADGSRLPDTGAEPLSASEGSIQ